MWGDQAGKRGYFLHEWIIFDHPEHAGVEMDSILLRFDERLRLTKQDLKWSTAPDSVTGHPLILRTLRWRGPVRPFSGFGEPATGFPGVIQAMVSQSEPRQ